MENVKLVLGYRENRIEKEITQNGFISIGHFTGRGKDYFCRRAFRWLNSTKDEKALIEKQDELRRINSNSFLIGRAGGAHFSSFEVTRRGGRVFLSAGI